MEGKSFDTVTRRCVVSAFKPAPPVIDEFNIVINEDSVREKIEIPYFDKNKDIAKICEVIDYGSLLSDTIPTCECIAGSCFAYLSPNENIHGETFVSFILTDKDGKSKEAVSRVEIKPVNDAPEVLAIAPGVTTDLTYLGNPHTFSFLAADIDNEPVTGCEVVARSENLILGDPTNVLANNCFCTIDDISSVSTCSVQISVSKNIDSLDEFISFRVFSLGDYSEVSTTRFTITDTDDPPLLCLYSRGVDFPECGVSGCIGSGAPDTNFMAPSSHTEKKPVIYLDETNGECYYSTSTSSFSKSINGAPNLEFGYIYVDIEEDSVGNVFSLRPGVDVDSVVNASTSSYKLTIDDDSEYSNDVTFSAVCADATGTGTDDILDCAIDAPADKNDFFIHRVVILDNTDLNPSLVFREREINGMKDKGITLQSGATGGTASVDYSDDIITITIEDGVTTAQTIKEAVENNEAVSSLVKVNLFGSKKEEVFNDDGSDWPKNFELLNFDKTPSGLKNDQKYFSYFSYKISVQNPEGTPIASNSVPVFVSISSKNDSPEARDKSLGSIGNEENATEFSLPIAKDENDFHNEDLSYIITGINSYNVDGESLPVGAISHCANLDNSDGPSDLTCHFNPSGNFNGDVTINYRAIDQYGASSSQKEVTFSISNIDDPPVLCQYHRFNQAQECGLDGCISEHSPVGRITPSSHVDGAPVYFYQKGAAYCYRSTGTGVNDWEIDATGHIGDVIVNQQQEVIIDNIAVDEGGPGDEDAQKILITDVAVDIESGDSDLLEIQLVKFFDNDSSSFVEFSNPDTDLDIGDENTVTPAQPEHSFDLKDFKIKVTPQASRQGVARVTFKITDGENNLTSSFLVTVQNVDVSHEGWKNIQAIGPKIGGSGYCEGVNIATGDSYIGTKLTKSDCDSATGGIWRDGDILESPYVCSFSETKCNGGEKCTGTSVSGVKADEFNAIFSQVTAGGERSCYRARGKLDLGYLTLKSKKAGSVIVVVENTDSATDVELLAPTDCEGAALGQYKFSGGDVFHHVKLNLRYGATTDEVYEAFESNANEILEVINNSPAQVMSLNNGIYTLGVRDVYLKRVGGLLFASHEEGMSVEIIDQLNLGINSSIIGNNLLLRKGGGPASTTCHASLLKEKTLNKIMIIDLDADDEGENDLGVLTTSRVSLQKYEASYEWDSLQTYCNITQSDEEPLCREDLNLGASCAGGSVETSFSNNKILKYNSFYADLDSRRCYRSDLIGDNSRYVEYVATGETTLSWESFRATGGSISGYEIFRKLGMVTSEDNGVSGNNVLDDPSPAVEIFYFNDQKPIATLDGGNHTSFVDNYSTTRHPPVPGTVYFYEVRPIVEGVQASSMEDHSVVRIFSPPKNFVFVHRWIANQTMCNLMNSQSRTNASDRMKGYDDYLKCTYTGPENDGSNFYDLGHDLLVMQVEAGCPYTRRGCSGDDYEDGDCIGAGPPGVDTNASSTTLEDDIITPSADNAIYFDRLNQICYERDTSLVRWEVVNIDQIVTIRNNFSNQKLPPLTGVSKSKSESQHCNIISQHLNTNTLGVVTIDGNVVDEDPDDDIEFSTVKDFFFSTKGGLQVSNLPTRLEQIAYSQWDTDTYTHEEIEILEQGLSLNATSRCNSSFASGIEDEFINGDSFSVTAPYTKTATENSLDGNGDRVRSLETGSSITKNCKSRYGVQDHVGNVSELSQDELTYSASHFFEGFDDYDSPCENGNPADGCDSMPDDFSWSFDQESNEATFFNLPLGLPFSNETVVDSENFNYVEINTTAGITTEQLHDDYVSLRDEFYNATIGTTDTDFILSGGSYKTGRGAGTWTLELLNEGPDSTYKDVGFRCVIPLKEENYFEAQFGKGLKNH